MKGLSSHTYSILIGTTVAFLLVFSLFSSLALSTTSMVSINDDSVDVIVGAAEITDEQKAQIEDIVTRKTERNVSDIVITTME